MKQIFIPKRWFRHNTFLCIDLIEDFYNDPDSLLSRNSPGYYTILGIVNEILENKANCKEIVSIEFKIIDDDLEGGYEITYLESDMIASKDDLESSWNDGHEEGCQFTEAGSTSYENRRESRYFHNWFEENFNDNDKT